jgi:putative ABC transport system substrate-binding protein
VVFSSSVAHVGRGVLFSLYPDNVALGRTLAASALTRLAANGPPPRIVTPLQAVRVAVNVRTARHLGLAISRTEQQSFDLVFPQQ